jgi:hypothetical protein
MTEVSCDHCGFRVQLNPVGKPEGAVSDRMQKVWEAHLESHSEESCRLTVGPKDYSVLKRASRKEAFIHGPDAARSILESGLAFVLARKERRRLRTEVA